MNTRHYLPKTSKLNLYIGKTYGWLEIKDIYCNQNKYAKCFCKCNRCGKET